jgi:NADH:ubiquinone oxidoreductase subunit F (NADH-binding)/(2Fe-2S) ferredoxin/Pyruvate/2-oxoacid:ferredoxin oxidoreductase delta subunit
MTRRLTSVQALENLRDSLLAGRDPQRPVIALCAGTGCQACGCGKVAAAFDNAIRDQGLQGKVELRLSGCQLLCERGPLALVLPHGFFYQRLRPEDAAEVVETSAVGGKVIERLLYSDPATGKRYVRQEEVPFFSRQQRLLTANNGAIDPTKIEDYIAADGFRALARVLTGMKPEEVVALIRRSGLRGRGGGGYPTGVKWAQCRNAPSADGVRYIIGNGDEGDPGAFMDRSLMEDNAPLVIEGMTIGAYAIGKPGRPVGYLYVRNEYPLAVERLELALRQARELGLLGENILGTGFDFDIQINRGGGAFVCGESTALMASIEGFAGQPRAKYVHTVERGLNSKPTNLNNVETWANVPLVIERGAEWFSGIGTGDVSKDPWGGSTGTKIFALVGKVINTGLVEVPMGRTLREIIFDIGGGIRDGKKFKAVQTGGPSGGCLPEEALDLPVDFDNLTKAGSMMGSGGMIVMDEGTCMVDVARYFVDFLVEESCGKCVPCREGLTQLSHMLHAIVEGKATDETLVALEALSDVVRDASLCALGQTAPNPVLSTLKHFRGEYEAHIREHRCPAAVCKSLLTFGINDKCNGCLVCLRECPSGAITGERKKLHVIDPAKCTHCGVCQAVCKFNAVDVR